MAMTVDELQVLITAQTSKFNSEIAKVQSQISGLDKNVKNSSTNMTKGFGSLAAKVVSVGAIIKATASSITAAMNYIEDENLFQVSMGKWADATREWSKQVQDSVGVSGAWLRKYSGVMTNMTASMGIAQDEAVKLGKGIALLSNDIASFYNISPESAFEKIQSAMAGMPRPLQELGIMVRDSEVKQVAYANGIARTGDELNTQQKALATYLAILQRTSNAQGDLARTINSPANQMRMLKTSIIDLGVAIGNMFQPLLSVVLPVLNAIVIATTRAFQAIARLFGIEFDASAYAQDFSDISTGIGSVGDAADSSSGKVKKLAKQLAAFDEMNTLNAPDDSSSGGSSGGGGGGTIDLPKIDWDSLYSGNFDKITNKALEMADRIYKAFEKMGKKLNNTFKKIEWEKISKGLNEVWEALKPFGDRIGAGLEWLYDNVLEPLTLWAMNDFIPAAFHAIAGALNLIGAVIDACAPTFAWLFDNFLRPIAEFTGGIIVSVLQGIGDMLNWIAQQQAVVELIKNIALTIGIMVAAWEAYQLIAGIVTGIQIAMTGAMVAGTTASGAYAVGLGVVTAAQSACATAGQILNAVFSTTSIVGLAITAVLTGISVVNEALKLSTMEAELAERNRMDTVKLSTQTTEWHNEAIQRQKELIDELEDAELNAVDSELAYINAQEQATKKREKYNEMLNAGTYSTDELHKAELEALSAEGRATAAKEKLAEAQQTVTDKTEEYGNMEWKRIMTEKQAELLDLAKAGRYEDINQKLLELGTSTIEYKDAHGKMVKFTEEDAENMALFIGDQLAKADEGYKKFWNSSTDSIKEAVKVADAVEPQFEQSGRSFAGGIATGINQNSWQVSNAAKNSALAAKNTFNSTLQIKSPSRVMKKSGGFFVAGIAGGIAESIHDAESEVVYMANKLTGAVDEVFSGYEIADIGQNMDIGANIGSDIDARLRQSELRREMQEKDDEEEPIALTVKIGEDTILDKIVSGINEKSFMNNMGVISI
ncbi:hypothetical protein [Candidatus Nanosyncoccus alces]|uniref:Bacteriophage tail tape measure N-terminal domain-containing protein n=1 Tax=Candidatus Nanosyncoccus alces TaxID=2171997 RepID=A0ABY0FQD1_9BACT|nr:hypothetical protein [Candidatus Nanosyncoccus alces]RYC75237.1 hypothetical protein G3RUM_00184 [Candidatus Nanosyncoccus alces]